MVTCTVVVYDNQKSCPLEDVQVTIGEEIKLTDAKGQCLFNNIKPGIYDIRLFKDGVICMVYPNREISEKTEVFHMSFGVIPEKVFIKVSADKTKIKKNETVTIVAQLFKFNNIATDIKQVSFLINDTQKVISDFDTDKEIAIMTLKGSNQGKVKITAQAQFKNHVAITHIAYSNELFIQDGDEE